MASIATGWQWQSVGTWAVAAVSLAGIAFWADFKAWQRFGTGGTPPTLAGYLKIQRWGLYLFLTQHDPHSPTPIPQTGPTYLSNTLPPRHGPRPRLTRWTLPQRHHPLPLTPSTRPRLDTLMTSLATSPTYSPYITSGPSRTEGGTGTAIYVRPGIQGGNPDASRIFYEVAHVHPGDGSLHVYVAPRDARRVVEAGWGARFPVGWLAPASWVLVYAPRDEGEFRVVRGIVRAGVCFAVGRELGEEYEDKEGEEEDEGEKIG